MNTRTEPEARRPAEGATEDAAVLAALAGLPREQASAGFTASVLARSTPQPAPRELGWSRSTMMLAASLVLVTVVTAGVLERAHQKKELRGRVNALRSEHDLLEQELAALKRASADEPAVVYLGGDENYDVVLTLDPKAATQNSNGVVVPTAAPGNHGI